MDENLLALIYLTAIGVFFFLVIFVTRMGKLPEEAGIEMLYEEHCSATWKFLKGVLLAGGVVPSRVSFYEEFFVVSLIKQTKIDYKEVSTMAYKSDWFSKSIIINFDNGSSLVLKPKNVKIIQSIIKDRRKREE